MEQRMLQTLGMDVQKKEVSLAYLFAGETMPTPMSVSADDGKYRIPTALFYRKEVREWLIGEEALFAAESQENAAPYLVRNVFGLYRKKQNKYMEESYTGEELLGIFFKELFKKAKERIGFSTVDELVVTGGEGMEEWKDILQERAKEICAFRQLRLISQEEAFAFYVLGRDKELWSNDATLFALDEDGFQCMTFSRKKQNERQVFQVRKEDLSAYLSMQMLQEEAGKREADENFLAYLCRDYKTHIVSSVYFTGEGFADNWYKKSAGEICRRRRAFVGFNLFSEGAALAPLMEKNQDFSLYCEGRTRVSIAVPVQKEQQEVIYPLSAAGKNYREQEISFECIADDTEEMRFLLETSFPQKGREELVLSLKDLMLRRDKTSTLRVTLRYLSEEVFEIEITEIGFGTFYPASGKSMTKRISI